MLEIRNLHVKLEEEDKPILKGVDLTIEAGKVPEHSEVEYAPEIHDASGADTIIATPHEPGERPLPFGFQPEEDKR